MKDYFDVRALAREGALNSGVLGDAITATFARRGTALPSGVPLGLSEEFARDAAKLSQWNAFLRKNRLDAPALGEVVAEVRAFLAEPMRLARSHAGAA